MEEFVVAGTKAHEKLFQSLEYLWKHKKESGNIHEKYHTLLAEGRSGSWEASTLEKK